MKLPDTSGSPGTTLTPIIISKTTAIFKLDTACVPGEAAGKSGLGLDHGGDVL